MRIKSLPMTQKDVNFKSNGLKNLIIQAGGRSKRMGSLTWNRPKCLVPIEGAPLLLHLRKHFPNIPFWIIGDYQFEALESYLRVMGGAEPYHLINSTGKGDVAGIQKALELIQDGPFAIIWSDLLLDHLPAINTNENNYIGLTREFECRWSFENGKSLGVPSSDNGIIGFFTFKDRSELPELPASGQFLESVREIDMTPVYLDGTQEIGTKERFLEMDQPTGRPYNDLFFTDSTVIKTCNDPKLAYKIEAEARWYDLARNIGFNQCPEVLSESPLTITKIHGSHPFDMPANLEILDNILETLEKLHKKGTSEFSQNACEKVHIDIPQESLERIRPMIPEYSDFRINGRLCKNPLADRSLLESCRKSFKSRPFTVIHGECTFSNTLIGNNNSVYFIDPCNSYGGVPQPYGNPLYDWSKIYYSIMGRYDTFNQKRFELRINKDEIDFVIEPSGWETFIPYIEERFSQDLAEIRIMQATEWFLLSTHAIDDYDAILGAFFRGVELLNMVLDKN